uniref:ETS domain-containing protein n=1 Tax=uncultured Thiotrichaceae bacterium TaxID=298394 RepID=A0A6S6U7F4_9GAMM|nr:MAG: Unknown protein [uncultured Thiotrichaceae bacterium]
MKKGEQGLFQAIRNHPTDYIWLYFTLFSTLIPTVLHLNFACFSLLATHIKPIPALLRTLAKPLYQPGQDKLQTVLATLGLCAVTTLFIVGPIAAISHLWQFLLPLLMGEDETTLQLLLNVAEQWAVYLQS